LWIWKLTRDALKTGVNGDFEYRRLDLRPRLRESQREALLLKIHAAQEDLKTCARAEAVSYGTSQSRAQI